MTGHDVDPRDFAPTPPPDRARRAQEFYTRWACLYDVLARHTPGVQDLRGRAAAALGPKPGDTVVEFGCGTGANLPHLRERVGAAGRVVGVDFAPGVLGVARDRIERHGWENVHLVRGDATRPPIEDADAVLATFVVGMLPDPAAAVRRWSTIGGVGSRIALLDLARTTRPQYRPLNALFRGLTIASAPTKRSASAPTRLLDHRVATAHRTLFECCADRERSLHALGFARLSSGTIATE